MDDNDSPKSLKETSESENNTEDIMVSITKEKKSKKSKHKKRKEKLSKIFVNDINNLKILNIDKNKGNNKSENLIKMNNNNNKSKYYKFVGHTIFVFMDKEGNPLLIIGPQWPLFVCFFSIVNILYLLVTIRLWSKFSYRSKLINQISYWSFSLSYSFTALINPGYPKNNHGRKTGYPRDEYYFCPECHFYVNRKTNASHCYDCGICIEQQDHHCPWTSHCVGKNNIISFYIFIISTLFSICYLPLAFISSVK
jgi:palmitoyltransferase ZDHHC9/14/18/palmitoyltransferase